MVSTANKEYQRKLTFFPPQKVLGTNIYLIKLQKHNFTSIQLIKLRSGKIKFIIIMANHFRDHNCFSNSICKMPIYFK